MILELVEFNSPKGWSRQQVAEEARNVIPKWRANKELLRKHFLLELNGKTGAGVYIWPSVEAAQKAHDEEWRQSVIKRTGGAPTIRYFDLFLLVDNEKGEVIEFPEAAEPRHGRRDSCAFSVRISVRAAFSVRARRNHRRSLADAAACLLALGARGCARTDRGHRVDARCDG
jgi:hypothetical protein